jgi:hypothetical protein
MDIEQIANNIDRNDNRVVLTLSEAINLLINKASKNSYNCFLTSSIKFNTIFDSFINGQANLITLRESAEELINTAIDIDALISAIVESPHAEPIQINSNEIMPTSELEYKYMAYKLIDTIREWTDSDNHDKMLNEASKFVNMSYQLYRNIIILEKHLGGNFKLEHSNQIKNAAYAFDKLLLESVSTGAIALRPAILGGERRVSDVFPKKKRRWYLQYVVQR